VPVVQNVLNYRANIDVSATIIFKNPTVPSLTKATENSDTRSC
jgi:hypothetical protein